ncbi:spore cortex-lytic enzyme [Brevibacillus ginsengisoli]|uniref:spore cortex-lytic enzyme n=1 Tax=Brevibacillus ginsengisoli TaxID=363854 RepID=UPI003CFA0C5A
MKKWSIVACLLMLFAGMALQPIQTAEASPLLTWGSNSGDVWDLQYRLQLLGFYDSPLDGQYGYQTQQAVRDFQSEYGLAVDGIAGSKTWTSLKQHSVNAAELDMLAHLIYGEARGESYTGQVAVGAVVLNRVHSGMFPSTVAGTIFQSGAFTAVDDGQYWLTPNETAYKAAWDAARGWDPSGGALYYFNPDTATSAWIWSRPQIKRIGQHIFMD